MAKYRTYGMTTTCEGCRYWSEMIACAGGGRPLEALCLAEESPLRGQYTPGSQSCEAWASGDEGAIDAPGNETAYRLHTEDRP
jgi:hypothetical protein